MIKRSLLAALPLLLVLGCASAHGPTSEEEPLITIVSTPAETLFPPEMSGLEGCLFEGGELFEVASVDNNDVREHGPLWTLAISPDRRIAVASEDGTIKLWTLDGFVGELDPGAFVYGVEVDGAQVADLAFHGEQVVAGDMRGVVSAWGDGSPSIIGGTAPDVAITAVAVHEASGRVAHADEQRFGNVMIRGTSDGTLEGPLETELVSVLDLAFVGDQLLLVGQGASPALELRDAEDPTRVVARFETELSFNPLLEVAVSGGAETIAFVSPELVGVVDETLAPRWMARAGSHVPVSVSVADTGRAVFSAGAEGTLRAWSGVDGAALAEVEVDEPVVVRVDPAADLVVVGSRDGILHAFACRR